MTDQPEPQHADGPTVRYYTLDTAVRVQRDHPGGMLREAADVAVAVDTGAARAICDALNARQAAPSVLQGSPTAWSNQPEPRAGEHDVDDCPDLDGCMRPHVINPDGDARAVAWDEIRERAREVFAGRPRNAEGALSLPTDRNPWTALDDALNTVQPVLDEREREIAELGRMLAAQIGLYRSAEEDVDKAERERDEQRQRAEQAEALVRELTDDGDCHYDHHRQCQTHNLDDDPCPHTRAKDLLTALDQPQEAP